MIAHPLVSIVIPVHNIEKYLRQCLDSVLNQTLHEIEIICVNDPTIVFPSCANTRIRTSGYQ